MNLRVLHMCMDDTEVHDYSSVVAVTPTSQVYASLTLHLTDTLVITPFVAM